MKKFILLLLSVILLFTVSGCEMTEEKVSLISFAEVFEVPSTWRGDFTAPPFVSIENRKFADIHMNFLWKEGNIIQGTFYVEDDIFPEIPSGTTDFQVEFQGRAAKFKFLKDEYSDLDGIWLLYRHNYKLHPQLYKGIAGSDGYYYIQLDPFE